MATKLGLAWGSGGGGQESPKARKPKTAEDSLHSSAVVKILDLISEGEIEGFSSARDDGHSVGSVNYRRGMMRDVYLDKTPILRDTYSANETLNSSPGKRNFDIDYQAIDSRVGTSNQDLIDGFGLAEDWQAVGVKVTYGNPVVRTITSTASPKAKFVIVTIDLPKLEYYVRTGKEAGDIKGADFHYRVEISVDSGTYSLAEKSDGGDAEVNINARTANLYQSSLEIKIPSYSSQVNIRVKRMDADTSQTTIPDEFIWSSYTLKTAGVRTYPNSAIVALKLRAEQFSRIPNRTYRIRGVKCRIPSNATVSTTHPGRLVYSGNWDGTFQSAKWTTCPVWQLYDLLTSSYGFRDQILTSAEKSNFSSGIASRLDRWSFYSCSVYANELVDRLDESTSNVAGEWFQSASGITIKTVTGSGGALVHDYNQYDKLYFNFTSGQVGSYPADGIRFAVVDSGSYEHNGRVIPKAACIKTGRRPGDEAVAKWATFSRSGTTTTVTMYSSSGSHGRAQGDTVHIQFRSHGLSGGMSLPRTELYTISSVVSSTVFTITTPNSSSTTTGNCKVFNGGLVTITTTDDRKKEPRYACNVAIRTQEKGFSLINKFCSSFRAMPYWSAGCLTLSQDRPRDSSYLFTPANVSEEGFTYEGTDQSTRPTVVVAKYFNMATQEGDTVQYPRLADQSADSLITKYGVVKKEIDAFGCTSRSQAYRFAKWFHYTNNNSTEVVTFATAPSSGSIVRPGMVIEISDPVRAGARRGGRVNSSAAGWIKPDSVDGLPSSGTRTLTVIQPDATVIERSVSSIASGKINVTPAFDSNNLPANASVWVLQTSGLQTSTWRVISVEETEEHLYKVAALAYNSTSYDFIEQGKVLEARDITSLNEPPDQPENLALNEVLYREETRDSTTDGPINKGRIRVKAIISWDSVEGVNLYLVQIRVNGGNWRVNEIQGNDYELQRIKAGDTVKVKVSSIGAGGKYSVFPAELAVHTVLGKTAPPSDVTSLASSIDKNNGITLTWDEIEPTVDNGFADLDLAAYIVKTGSSWSGGTRIARVITSPLLVGFGSVGTTAYRIKAVDSSGFKSTNDDSVSITIAAPSAPTSLNADIEHNEAVITWTEPSTGSYSIHHYEISFTKRNTSTTKTVKVDTTNFRQTVNWTGSKTFTIKAVDVAGNNGATATVSLNHATIAAPAIKSGYPKYKDSRIILKWEDPVIPSNTFNLPVVAYKVKESSSSTAGSGTLVTKTESTKVNIDIENWTTRYIHVAAIDINGDLGAWQTSTISITTPPAPTLTYEFDLDTLVLKWTKVSGTLPTTKYEVYHVDGGSDVLLTESDNRRFKTKCDFTSKVFKVRAVTAPYDDGHTSHAGALGSVTVTPTTLSAPSNLTATFKRSNVVLKWDEPTVTTASLDIRDYEVRMATTTTGDLNAQWASATSIAFTSRNRLRDKVEHTGTKKYFVRSRDLNKQYGGFASVDVTVVNPSAPVISSSVTDNNVKLSWGDAGNSLPVDKYIVKRGGSSYTDAAAVVVFEAQSLDATIMEEAKGTFTYRVCAVDTAGNQSAEGNFTVDVDQPPGFKLHADYDTDFVEPSTTMVNCIVHDGKLYPGVNTSQTYQQHFATYGSIQAMIDAGYEYLLYPLVETASYQETYDHSEIIKSSRIVTRLTTTTVNIDGDYNPPSPRLQYKEGSGDGWTTRERTDVTFGASFRYVRFKWIFDQGSNGKDMIYVNKMNLQISHKIKKDYGKALANASDSDGTTVNFNLSGVSAFLAVDSVTATPNNRDWSSVGDNGGPSSRPFFEYANGVQASSNAAVTCVDFPEGDNPTSFKVFLYDSSGNRMSGPISWQATGT